MKRTTAAVILALGIAGAGKGCFDYNSRYSNDSVWKRQQPIVARFVRDDGKKKERLAELRSGLVQLPTDAREERCKFEKHFEAVTFTGDPKKAEQVIASKSFEPYDDCKPDAQLKDEVTKRFNIPSLIAICIGAFSLIRSFFRKKETD